MRTPPLPRARGRALGPRALAARDLTTGRRVIPSEITLPMDRGNVAVYSNALARSANLRLLVDALAEPDPGKWSE